MDQPPDPAAIALVRRFCAAWNRLDIDEICALLSDDVVYHNIPMQRLAGREAVEPYLRGAAMFDAAEWELIAIAANGATVLTERVDRFTLNGHPIALPVMGTFEVRGDRIAAWRDYFDLADYQRQLAAAGGAGGMSLADARTIDLHAHAVLEETFGTAGAFGPRLEQEADGTPVFHIGDYALRGVRYRGGPFMDVDRRIAAMDAGGIDWQLLSPNPLTYFHHIPPADAVAFCRRHNDAMAATVARYPGRLGGAAALPIQDVDAAIAELHRAVDDLGLLAAYIGTDLPHGLDDPVMDPFYEAVVALDVPLFLHPAPAGIDGPPGSPALRRYELDILAGFTAQETVAAATLVFGACSTATPALDVCISHGGGAVALVWGRLEAATRKRPWVPGWLRAEGAFAAQMRRLWYDVHMHDREAQALLAKRVGTARLVYGTNFAGWDAPDLYDPPAVDAPLADNARRLLRASRGTR